jgi:hypothetical protein
MKQSGGMRQSRCGELRQRRQQVRREMGGHRGGAPSSGWGRTVIARKKGETGGEPKSIAEGQGPPRDSWETELCAKQMLERKRAISGIERGVLCSDSKIAINAQFLRCFVRSQVVVCWMPVASNTAARKADKSSGAASEWMTSGEPRVNQMESKSRGMKVGTVRTLRGRTKTILVKLSMTAKASVSPVMARPWPWKSME